MSVDNLYDLKLLAICKKIYIYDIEMYCSFPMSATVYFPLVLKLYQL